MKQMKLIDDSLLDYVATFPSTRYMGSKRKLLPFISRIVRNFDVKTVFDAFAGSNCVAYEFKKNGLEVTTNDFLKFSYQIAHAVVENNKERVNEADIEFLLKKNNKATNFIEHTFKDLYFTDVENQFLDNIWVNIQELRNKYKKSLAFAAIHRSLLKRRPRGIFAYTGQRYNDGRKDLQKSLQEHFISAIHEWNNAIFDNGKKNESFNQDIFTFDVKHHDLVYLDPPYFSTKSDNDYTRRYHFLEGFASYWSEVNIDYKTQTKKIKSKDTPFSSKNRVYKAFDDLFYKFKDSIILLSYYSNGLPTKDELIEQMKRYKKKVEVLNITHSYSFGNQGHIKSNPNNKITEYLFIGR